MGIRISGGLGRGEEVPVAVADPRPRGGGATGGDVVFRPGGVFVFDTVHNGDVEAMNERVAACYAWAEHRRLVVLDEVISWLPRFEPDHDQALKRAAGQCRCHRAALLVHSADVVSEEREVIAELAGIPVWSVDARLPFG